MSMRNSTMVSSGEDSHVQSKRLKINSSKLERYAIYAFITLFINVPTHVSPVLVVSVLASSVEEIFSSPLCVYHAAISSRVSAPPCIE